MFHTVSSNCEKCLMSKMVPPSFTGVKIANIHNNQYGMIQKKSRKHELVALKDVS